MGNTLVNTRDQRFVLYEQIGIERLFTFEKFRDFSRDMIDMVLTEAEKFAVEEILPTFDIGDKEDPAVFKEGKAYAPKCYHSPYKKYVAGGWLCPMAPPEVGGQGLPMTVYTACSELFGAANYAFCMYPGLTLGAAAMIASYGTPEQLEKYALKMFAGEWSGTMCLTEPGAGTDVGALRTTAKMLPNGKFSISGTKCFISSGDHDLTEQIVHPVLARIEGDPAGSAGISIFIVPKYRVNGDGSLGEFNDIITGNIEHKMGIKGSATCTLNFGENGGCIGELLGNEREGMKVMFMMMNEARLGTGMQGLDAATASYEHAVQYAKERIQFRKIEDMGNNEAPGVAIINHPDIRRSLLWMKSHVEGMRSMNYFISYCIDMEHIATDEEEKAKMKGFVELLTPICKAYCSDKAVEICSLGMDVFGGYGYCSEYPMEQYLRDVKIATIYGQEAGPEEGSESDEPVRCDFCHHREDEKERRSEGLCLQSGECPGRSWRSDHELCQVGQEHGLRHSCDECEAFPDDHGRPRHRVEASRRSRYRAGKAGRPLQECRCGCYPGDRTGQGQCGDRILPGQGRFNEVLCIQCRSFDRGQVQVHQAGRQDAG